jgi:hypothetical protein
MFDRVRIYRWVSLASMLGMLSIPLGCSEEEATSNMPPPAQAGPDSRATLTPEDIGGLELEEVSLILPWSETTISRDPQPAAASVSITSVELTEEDGYDRMVLGLSTDAPFPGYRIASVEPPFFMCGSWDEGEDVPEDERGEAIELEGPAWLLVELTPARAHDDSGRATASELPSSPDFPVVTAVRTTCDQGETVSWILGVRESGSRRVLELKNPTRLVVDILHGG